MTKISLIIMHILEKGDNALFKSSEHIDATHFVNGVHVFFHLLGLFLFSPVSTYRSRMSYLGLNQNKVVVHFGRGTFSSSSVLVFSGDFLTVKGNY